MLARFNKTTARTSAAATLVLAGAAFGQGGYPDRPIEASFLRGIYGFEVWTDLSRAQLGRSIAPAGDFNGDGIDDLAVGSLERFRGFGAVIFGRADGAFGNRIATGDLDGVNGLTITQEPTGYVARSIAGVGDINGDGGSDLYVSAGRSIYADDPSVIGYVLFGRPPGAPGDPFPANIELSTLGPGRGVALALGEPFLFSEPYTIGAAVGDVNADGTPDLIVSVADLELDGATQGRVFVVYGNADGLPDRIELTELDGTNGFTIVPEADEDYLGAAVAGAGDINGDGFDDVVVGAPGERGTTSLSIAAPGAAYVVFGRPGGMPAEVSLADLDGTSGFAFKPDPPAGTAGMGKGVAGVGDLNGDGIDDVAFGEPGGFIDGYSTGRVHVVYGRDGAFPALLTPAALTPDTGLLIHPALSYRTAFGWSVAAAGDINGDGAHDMAIGVPGAFGGAPRLLSGAVVVFGSNDGAPLGVDGVFDASQAGGDRVLRLFDDAGFISSQFGNSVHGIGDINADGIDDLGVGAWQTNDPVVRTGRAYVHFGGGLCPVDLTADGALDVFDFLEYLNLFDAADPRAEWDSERFLTLFDFLAYQTDFDAGCP